MGRSWVFHSFHCHSPFEEVLVQPFLVPVWSTIICPPLPLRCFLPISIHPLSILTMVNIELSLIQIYYRATFSWTMITSQATQIVMTLLNDPWLLMYVLFVLDDRIIFCIVPSISSMPTLPLTKQAVKCGMLLLAYTSFRIASLLKSSNTNCTLLASYLF